VIRLVVSNALVTLLAKLDLDASFAWAIIGVVAVNGGDTDLKSHDSVIWHTGVDRESVLDFTHWLVCSSKRMYVDVSETSSLQAELFFCLGRVLCQHSARLVPGKGAKGAI
jgi:hypothetical protein